ncbi:CpsD/CapB family tyrosine-protein kinase [Myxococcota bacterium]|nr:CpsD/CapB family tyrosine-protein kinase [Myxococcota bacterium]
MSETIHDSPNPSTPEPPSGRVWGSNLPAIDGGRDVVRGQRISLADADVRAMPSAARDLAVLHDRDGPFASAVRILATRIEELRARMGFKSYVVTSVADGDGKTVLATNLALAMSEDSERRIALVDANFRAPRTAELFDLDGSRGILAALAGARPLSECVARVLGRNLVVLHAGGRHESPAAVLGSAELKALLAELYQAVDFMIVDAPSALPWADVPLLVQNVDAAILAISRDRTRRQPLEEALATIGRSRVVGSVFVDRPGERGPVPLLRGLGAKVRP